ncbi:unnamed protein product [Protopolystoma xenopodis]|uniref:Uncharacterized protein n=1 Tax=Protopolystoma xenopodis TaxID=117903 RepID=A0A3S5CRR8_9PLAT|nr:unnamed protein product [Protopolystoma xenopodis]
MPYNPFPPAPPKSRLDEELEQGTYFLSQAEQLSAQTGAKLRASEAISRKRQLEQRMAAFIPPEKKIRYDHLSPSNKE